METRVFLYEGELWSFFKAKFEMYFEISFGIKLSDQLHLIFI